jgi:hypothetical protein
MSLSRQGGIRLINRKVWSIDAFDTGSPGKARAHRAAGQLCLRSSTNGESVAIVRSMFGVEVYAGFRI